MNREITMTVSAPDADGYRAMRIEGDALKPRYRAGEYIVIGPGNPMPGSDVFLTLTDGRTGLMQLVGMGGGEVRLCNVNNPRDVATLRLGEVASIERVAGRYATDPQESSDHAVRGRDG